MARARDAGLKWFQEIRPFSTFCWPGIFAVNARFGAFSSISRKERDSDPGYSTRRTMIESISTARKAGRKATVHTAPVFMTITAGSSIHKRIFLYGRVADHG
jgi:hypothetical protein